MIPGTPAPGEKVVLKKTMSKNGIAPTIWTAWSDKSEYSARQIGKRNMDKLSNKIPKKNSTLVNVPITKCWHPN